MCKTSNKLLLVYMFWLYLESIFLIYTRFLHLIFVYRREDYDLCDSCFKRMGNEIEYTKIEKPVLQRLSRDSSVVSTPFGMTK
jgi:hypothetical protein